MEFKFDTEIDTILRQARGIEDLSSNGPHLDADEISAFADNALPDAARMRFTAHLADCGRCRKILSNSFEPNEVIDAVAAAVPVVTVPWHRRLFVFPQLAYTMGALVILFSGFFGYVLIRNIGSGSEMASSPKNTVAEKPSAQATAVPSSAANSAVATVPANIEAPNTNSTAPKPEPLASSSPSPSETANDGLINETAKKNDRNEIDAKAATNGSPALSKDESNQPKPSVTQDSLGGVKPDLRDRATPKPARSVTDDILTEDREADKSLGVTRSAPAEPKKRKAGDARNIGGKTFNNVGGIWFDSEYNKQPTTTVERNTDEYRKLDSGLRSIADQLGGTVVILWKSKGYRIQ